MGRSSPSILRIHQLLQTKPLITIPAAAKQTGLSQPTIAKALGQMQTLAIVHETTGRPRSRVFVYDRYLSLLAEGTDPLVD